MQQEGPVNQIRFDPSLPVLAGSTGRRGAVRSLGAIGAALLAALGLAGSSSAGRQHRAGGRGDRREQQQRNRDRSRNRNQAPERERGSDPEETADEPPAGTGPAGAARTEKKRRTKRGPAGPAGPTGPAATTLATRIVTMKSEPLPVTAGSAVAAVADCGGASKLVACGYRILAPGDQLMNAYVTRMEPYEGGCLAEVRRTTADGSTAGAQIEAIATCLL